MSSTVAISLHQAQAAASDAFRAPLLPCYRSDYIQSQQGLTRMALGCYSKIYDVVSSAYSRISSAVSGALSLGNKAFGPVLDIALPVNPINGKRQFLCMPRAVEKALGDFFYYPLVTYGLRGTNELIPGSQTRIADSVVNVMDRVKAANIRLLNPEDATPFDYRVKTVHSSQVNAFAVPAGGMVVFTQIVKEIDAALKSQAIKQSTIEFADGSRATVDLTSVNLEDVLAALLGHEMTHVASRHSIVAMGSQMITSIFLSMVRTLLCTHLNSRLHEALFTLEEWLNRYLQLLNSRSNEYEADVTGAYFAHQAHFNPLGAIYLQEVLKQGSWEYSDFFHKYFEFLYTHPYVENRKRAIFAAVHQMAPNALRKQTVWAIADEHHYDLSRSGPAMAMARHLHPT